MRKVRIGNDINVRWEVKTDGQAVSLEGKMLKLYVRSAYRKEEITTFTVEGCVVSFTYPASMQRMTGARAVILEDATEGAPRRTVCADQAFTLVAHSCEESDDDVEFEDFMVSLQSNVLIGKPGLSAYEVWLSEGYTGTLEDWYAFLRKPATDIAADVAEAEAERKAAEKLRDTAENDRNDAEQERRQHEDARADAEGKRDTAETLRKQAETGRDNAETERTTAEQTRKDSEASRVVAEQRRTASEQTRQENETARVTAETERKSAEQERTTAETERTTSEQARQENETARVSAETERVVAELSRQRAEAKREQAAKDNKDANDAAVAAAYAAADTADTATGKANTAATNADTATANANSAADDASKVNAVLGDDNVLKVTDRTGAEKSLELVAQAAATEMAKKVEQNTADIAELSSKISEERTRVDGELEKKFAKADIVQESGNSEKLVMSQKAVSDKLNGLSTEIIYDASAHNDGAVFESLQALLSSSNLSTLIPTSVRHGGMNIRFIRSSDNKYVQYRLMSDSFSTTEVDWQGVDDYPIKKSRNLIESGGVDAAIKDTLPKNTDEDGLYICDKNGNVVIRLDILDTKGGFGENLTAAINTLIEEALLEQNTIIKDVLEEGFYICNENGEAIAQYKNNDWQFIGIEKEVKINPCYSSLGLESGVIKTDTLSNGELVLMDYPQYLKRNATVSFGAKIDTFSQIKVGVKGGYFCLAQIDSTNISIIHNTGTIKTEAHGLNISGWIDVVLKVEELNVEISIHSLDGYKKITATLPYRELYGRPTLEVDENTNLTDISLRGYCDDFQKSIWFVGDSYTSCTEVRWTGQMLNFGIDNWMLLGVAGGKSKDLYEDLLLALKYGTPTYLVWCMGMNDADNGSLNTDYKKYFELVKAKCDELGIIMIPATVPCVKTSAHPTYARDNSYKNAFIKASGLRYIDLAKAVGGDTFTEDAWYEGYLETKSPWIHTSELGAKAQMAQIIRDFPEILRNK